MAISTFDLKSAWRHWRRPISLPIICDQMLLHLPSFMPTGHFLIRPILMSPTSRTSPTDTKPFIHLPGMRGAEVVSGTCTHEVVKILLHYLLYHYCVYLGITKEKWDGYHIALESWEGQDKLIWVVAFLSPFFPFLTC
jgi:hypothetical protein